MLSHSVCVMTAPFDCWHSAFVLQSPCFDAQLCKPSEKIFSLPVNMTARTMRTINAKAATIMTLIDILWDFLWGRSIKNILRIRYINIWVKGYLWGAAAYIIFTGNIRIFPGDLLPSACGGAACSCNIRCRLFKVQRSAFLSACVCVLHAFRKYSEPSCKDGKQHYKDCKCDCGYDYCVDRNALTFLFHCNTFLQIRDNVTSYI